MAVRCDVLSCSRADFLLLEAAVGCIAREAGFGAIATQLGSDEI